MNNNAKCLYTVLFFVFFNSQILFAEQVQTYRNEKVGFEISYLSNWMQAQSPGKSVFFIKRVQEDQPATISINVAKYSGNKSSFIQEMKDQSTSLLSKFQKRFPDSEMLENGDTYLGGHKGYYHIIKYTIKNLNIAIDILALQVICIKDEKLFLINFETPLLFFDNTFNEFQAILATFNFR